MKMRFRHIRFTKESTMEVAAKPMWFCRANKDKSILGTCTYYDTWSTWVFEGEPNCVFDKSCLRDIATFLESL